MEELLSLKWNNHSSTFLQVLSHIRCKQQYSDVTLICKDKYYHVHRMVLSTCSDYFKGMFEKLSHHQALVIVLNDIKPDHFDLLLDYMYLGEVNVKQADLPALIKTSEFLQIKGLAVADEEPAKSHGDLSQKRKLDSPSSKRKKKLKRNDTLYKDSHNIDAHKSSNDSSLSFHQDSGGESPQPEVIAPVKEEPFDVFEDDVIACDDIKQPISSPDFKDENNSKVVLPEYQPDSEPQGSLDMDDSNFSSSSTQDQSANWKESDFSMNLTAESVASTIEPTALRMGIICQWCNKGFICQSALDTHIRVHTGEKPFLCHYCDYRARQKANLIRHIGRKHL